MRANGSIFALFVFVALAGALPACDSETRDPTVDPEPGAPAAGGATADPAAEPAADPAAEPPDRGGDGTIAVSFQLDPRLTTGLYMGERWVSPPTYTRVAAPGEDVVSIPARARVLDATGRPVDSRPSWTAADAAIVTVRPGPDDTVVLDVLGEGETRVDVVAPEAAKALTVVAAVRDGVFQVDITQDP